MGRVVRTLLVLSLLVSFTGCGEVDDPPGGAGGSGGGEGKETAEIGPIEWAPCVGESPRLRCATTTAPIDWADPSSDRIDLFLRKWETQVQPRRGQLWMLQGGPGFGAESLVNYAPHFAADGFDVYMPDYRGVGRSTPLACVGEEGDEVSAACMAELVARWGDRVRFFSSTDAATDVAKEIEALRGDDDVFVYGISYGTFVANRLLSLFPDLVDGAVLDSICPPTGCSIHTERNMNRSAERVFGLCGAEPDCRARLSSDPWARLQSLIGRLEAGHCSEFAGEGTAGLFSRILGTTIDMRIYVPVALAVTYRLDRCDPEDVAALHHFLEFMNPVFGFSLAAQADYAPFAYWNIYFSEFWDEGLLPEDYLAEVKPLVIRLGAAEEAVKQRERWVAPTWTVPHSLRRWADVKAPALLLNGDLDARTPAHDLEGIDAAFSRPHQSWIEVPYGSHGIIMEGAGKGGLGTCGYEVIRSFLANPLEPPATSCLAGLEKLDLDGDRLPAERIFGTSDLWENGVSMIRAPQVRDPAFELARQRLRERWFGRPTP